MYDAHTDPYIYPDAGILKNLANIRDAEKLNPDRFLDAMIRSFVGDMEPLEIEVGNILG